MARTKVVNGVRMNYTPEEEVARDAEEAAWQPVLLIAQLRD